MHPMLSKYTDRSTKHESSDAIDVSIVGATIHDVWCQFTADFLSAFH